MLGNLDGRVGVTAFCTVNPQMSPLGEAVGILGEAAGVSGNAGSDWLVLRRTLRCLMRNTTSRKANVCR